MMADKGEQGVVGVAEPVLSDKNDDHVPEGVAASDHLSCYAPVFRASRPAADFLASGSVTSFSTCLSVCDQTAGRGRLVDHAVPIATRCFSSSLKLRCRRNAEPCLACSMTSVLQGCL